MALYKDQTHNRIKKVLITDKLINPVKFKQTLKLEMYNTLSQFMDLDINNMKVNITVNGEGKYIIGIAAISEQIKPIGVFATDN